MRKALFYGVLYLLLPNSTLAQDAAADLTSEEQALCRPDAIRFCLFKVGNADAFAGLFAGKQGKPVRSLPRIVGKPGQLTMAQWLEWEGDHVANFK